MPMEYAVVYFAAISLVSVIVTAYDKIAAKKPKKRRIRESTLMLLAALGGALFMYLTMQLIRHKTRHLKFMAGLPLIILLQAAAVALCLFLKQ